MKIETLNPQLLWGYFKDITAIPRPSGSEERIIEWLESVAEANSLSHRRDATGNLLITAAATAGCEGRKRITMQAHVDMVCEKRGDSTHDFMSDPIDCYIEDGWVRARGTTLGADCGIGVAAALAALTDPDLQHGELEALFTLDEERGLTGAFGLGEGMIGGDYLLNLDSEEEGEIYIGCAGGVDTTARFTLTRDGLNSGDYIIYRLSVGGLQGGHSGDDINKGRGNAVKILSRMLFEASLVAGIRLITMEAGNLRNAIPREGWADVAVGAADESTLLSLFEGYRSSLAVEFQSLDSGLTLTLERCDSEGVAAIDVATQFTILGSLVALPNGVMEMSSVMEGLVESSTNLAAVKISDYEMTILTSQRSSTIEGRERVKGQVAKAFTDAGASVEHSDGYPGWAPNPQSELVAVAQRCYREIFDCEANVRAIHAGLECGLFLESYPDLDMISFGPTMRGVHSPDERLEVASVERFWRHLCAIIESV